MGPYRVKISFDVLQLLNHRTDGRCTTQSVDIIDGPRVRDTKNNVISMCGKKVPLTDFVTHTNTARVRIVSDYYGDGINNKFKLRYKRTKEPSNFSDHENDKIKTSKSGFVHKQSAVSKDIRHESGPIAEKFTDDQDGILMCIEHGGLISVIINHFLQTIICSLPYVTTYAALSIFRSH